MNVADVSVRYDTAQSLMTLHIETDAEDTSISDHYVLLHFPHSVNAAKSAWKVQSATKVELEAIYSDELPTIGVTVNVTAGASTYPVRVSVVSADGTAYEFTGNTGTEMSAFVPIPGASTPPVHPSTLPPGPDTLAIDGDGNSIPGKLMFPPASPE